jgi:uncharacterized coiled-coil DUF342 family protein
MFLLSIIVFRFTLLIKILYERKMKMFFKRKSLKQDINEMKNNLNEMNESIEELKQGVKETQEGLNQLQNSINNVNELMLKFLQREENEICLKKIK